MLGIIIFTKSFTIFQYIQHYLLQFHLLNIFYSLSPSSGLYFVKVAEQLIEMYSYLYGMNKSHIKIIIIIKHVSNRQIVIVAQDSGDFYSLAYLEREFDMKLWNLNEMTLDDR